MTKTLAAFAFALATTVTGVQAATLVNGSFEDPLVNVGPFKTLNTGSPYLAGWTVDGSIDWIGSYWAHADGNRSLDMTGSSIGSISQDITGLVVGRQYDLSFALAGNPAGRPQVKTLNVSVGDEMAEFTFDTAGTSRGNMGWVMESFRFTAGSTTETLTFASKNTGFWGPALDNVSISQTAPVPLPAAAWLLAGAVAGLATIRRKA